VAAGKIRVCRDAVIRRLLAGPAGRFAELSTGECVPADMVVCATGWQQRVPFLSDAVMASVTDAKGNFRLYRSILPVHVPRLAFNGYNSSLFSQLSCEVGALWIADLLGGQLKMPTPAEQDRDITERLNWIDKRNEGKHAKGTNVVPFSLHHVDELLQDIRLPLGVLTRVKHWLLPVNPADYAGATRALLARYRKA
jgi:dimethylaniline monooxygenase (N-oxide forming)